MLLVALYDDDRWASTEGRNTPKNHRRGPARDHVPRAPGILVTAERKTWICDQFRNRTESICQWILFNWKEESDILPRFVTYETGWPY